MAQMDPDASLRLIVEHAKVLARDDGELPHDTRCLLSMELAESILALNNWIQRGGFLPQAWVQKGN